MKKLFFKGVLGIVAVIATLALSQAFALNYGDLDTTFTTSIPPGFNSTVYASAVQSDGKILMGGAFTDYEGQPANRIIRFNADGSRDTSFNIGNGFNSSVLSIAIQSDGKIIVGGDFSTYQGQSANRIIRLNADGSRDSSFINPTQYNTSNPIYYYLSSVNKLMIQDDGTIFVAAYVANTSYSYGYKIIRLNTDGSINSSLNVGDGFNYDINSIAVQSDGKIIVGGSFSTYQGQSANYIIRLNADGSRDTSFNIGNGFNYNVKSIAIQSDGKIIVGGYFSSYQGQSANRIIRLNADGSRDTSFNINGGFNSYVYSIAIQSDGKIIVGGSFTAYQGQSANRIIRLNADGSRDTSFNIGNGFNNDVTSIAIQTDGKIIVRGYFSSYQGQSANYIIRLNADGSRDSSFNMENNIYGFNSNINSIAVQSDGKIVVGGSFSTYQGQSANRIIRLNADGSRDSSFNIGNGFNSDVTSIAVQSDGKIIVGGYFSTYQGQSANFIIRLNADGSRDSSFVSPSMYSDPNYYYRGNLRDMTIQNDGKILLGGYVYNSNWKGYYKIMRLDANGSIDTSFNIGDGFNNEVRSIAVQTDGKIVVGGSFSTYQGQSANYIIRLNADGSRDSSFNVGNGFNSSVLSIAIQSDGKIIVGGYFSTYQGQSADYIIRLNADGSKDSSFVSLSMYSDPNYYYRSNVSDMTIQNDGKILIVGYVYNSNWNQSYKIMRLDANGSIDTSFNVGNGFNSSVYSIAIQSDGKILVGGAFRSYQGQGAGYITRLYNVILPKMTFTYNKTTLTNQDVVVTLSFPDLPATIINNGGSNTHTFTGNGSFTFEVQDTRGYTGYVVATVNRIDKVAPIGTINYSTTTRTKNPVTAQITTNEAVTMLNGSSYTFNKNGNFTFNFMDLAGNTANITATVSRIDELGTELQNKLDNKEPLSGQWRRAWWVNNFGNDCPSCTTR